MTGAQHEVLRAIKTLFSKNGYSPTYKQIAEECGYNSQATVFKHVQALSDAGYIIKGEGGKGLVLVPNELGGFHKCERGHVQIFYLCSACPMCALIHGVTPPREVSRS
jgi:SOS-response transcriptional repressor LexA